MAPRLREIVDSVERNTWQLTESAGSQLAVPEFLLRGGHVILAGNPGVGKSSLLNAIAQVPGLFPSGFSVGRGLTEVLHTKRIHNLQVSDTPGLDDIERKKQAAHEIAEAISLGGPTVLFFVMTVEAGRIRPQDIATAELVLKSLKERSINMENSYGVIVNKATPPVMQNAGHLAAIINQLLSAVAVPNQVMMHRLVPNAIDTDLLMDQPVDLIAQMLQVPFVNIPRGTRVEIQVDKLQALQARIAELERKLQQGAIEGPSPLATFDPERASFWSQLRDSIRTRCTIL